MTLQEAIETRHSVRNYKAQPLSEDVALVLKDKIEELNRVGKLHMQLVQNEPKAFQNFFAKYGKFSNVTNYIVMAGRKAEDLDERLGYYGEQIVLLAQTLGLNTCWAGLSYSKVPGTYVLNEGETIQAYISIGYGATQGVTHKIKSMSQVSNADEQTPDWFNRGVTAALLAPTAINQQKFFFQFIPATGRAKPLVKAKRIFSLVGFTQMDLGISKYHFEIGAGIENFEWFFPPLLGNY